MSYDYDNWQVGFDNNSLEALQIKANFRKGTTLNLVPKLVLFPPSPTQVESILMYF